MGDLPPDLVAIIRDLVRSHGRGVVITPFPSEEDVPEDDYPDDTHDDWVPVDLVHVRPDPEVPNA